MTTTQTTAPTWFEIWFTFPAHANPRTGEWREAQPGCYAGRSKTRAAAEKRASATRSRGMVDVFVREV